MFATGLKCTECATTYALNEQSLVCLKCGSVLNVEYDLEKIRSGVNRGLFKGRIHSLWRYRELLPISHEAVVSMGEGLTPLKIVPNYGRSIGVTNLTLKLDYLNPTASFKDRGTTVNVSRLKELNTTSVVDDSSGNAGSSLAAYCASAGIECTLYVPANTPTEKIVQAEICGARIVKIPGSRIDAANAAKKGWTTSRAYYASHNLSAFFFEGMKTIAYEIAEMFDWQVPDHVAFPVGGGTLLAGASRGFQELKELGWANRTPRIHCIQSEACMPIVEAFRQGRTRIGPVVEGETIATAIRVPNPARGNQVLQALQNTRGKAAGVSDDAILRHQRLLARTEGIFAEPSSCVALAGIEKLCKMGVIKDRESVVVPLTGFGLKDTRNALISLARWKEA